MHEYAKEKYLIYARMKFYYSLKLFIQLAKKIGRPFSVESRSEGEG